MRHLSITQHKFSVRFMSGKGGGFTVCQEFSECPLTGPGQIGTDDTDYYPASITYCCWGTWTP